MGRLSKPKKIENQKLMNHINSFKKNKDNASFQAIVEAIKTHLDAQVNKFFYIPGNNHDDIYQEALYALSTKAIPDYDESKGSFVGFVKLCVKRHIITILKSANNNKHKSLNSSMSLDQTKSSDDDDESPTAFGVFISTEEEPVIDSMIRNESLSDQKAMLREKLTDLESEILDLYLKDMSYVDIVQTMNKKRRGRNRVNPKVIDNALCRIKHKALEVEDSLRQRREVD